MGSRRSGRANRHLQAARVVSVREDFQVAAADDMRLAAVPNAALEGLHFEQARKALVRGARGPLAVGLHQFSQFLYSFQVRRGGVPSPEASAPTRFCVQGWEARTGGSRR